MTGDPPNLGWTKRSDRGRSETVAVGASETTTYTSSWLLGNEVDWSDEGKCPRFAAEMKVTAVNDRRPVTNGQLLFDGVAVLFPPK